VCTSQHRCPFTHLGQALYAALDNTIIVIEEGTYAEVIHNAAATPDELVIQHNNITILYPSLLAPS
jgi:hypothetical protein